LPGGKPVLSAHGRGFAIGPVRFSQQIVSTAVTIPNQAQVIVPLRVSAVEIAAWLLVKISSFSAAAEPYISFLVRNQKSAT
jgi:hypothetical protein